MSIIKIPIRTSFQEDKYFDRELQYSFIARCVFVYALYAVGVNARCALDTKVPLVL